ncbi:MAG: DNA polymerase III subunit epsilon, partial [Gammaproteobacteria bacterium]|nr:DNA polymerase III subunit epsilon [Gammaproteobacteria bacterium]
LEVEQGHRVIEIGCIELLDRRHTGNHFHQYISPEREIDEGALKVHGITQEFLSTQPLFQDVVEQFLDFVRDAELVIHNAEFDIGFLDYELALTGKDFGQMADHCQVLDTLKVARRMHPGQRNSLDALCRRYGVSNSGRDLHGALLDARLLSEVYLAMTGGQAKLSLDNDASGDVNGAGSPARIERAGLELTVIRCTDDELAAHEDRLSQLDAACEQGSVWRRLSGA